MQGTYLPTNPWSARADPAGTPAPSHGPCRAVGRIAASPGESDVAKFSAALLVYRRNADAGLEVLIAHMGGPFWANKDDRAWSIPKGECEEGEESLATARREFEEELGSPPPDGDVISLGEQRQSSGKVITTYAVQGDVDLSGFRSNTFTMEWPPRSGQIREFPEMDRAEWMSIERASQKLVRGQVPILDALRRQTKA
jgi:predicted NUDIX family NTP pyrophosphohydrolase